MSAAYTEILARLSDQNSIEKISACLLEDFRGRPAALCALLDTGLDNTLVGDFHITDADIVNDVLRISLECSTGHGENIVNGLFRGLATSGAKDVMAVEYNSKVGMYCCLIPGDEEPAYIEECIPDFEPMMHRLQEHADHYAKVNYCLGASKQLVAGKHIKRVLAEQQLYNQERLLRADKTNRDWEPIQKLIDAGNTAAAAEMIDNILKEKRQNLID